MQGVGAVRTRQTRGVGARVIVLTELHRTGRRAGDTRTHEHGACSDRGDDTTAAQEAAAIESFRFRRLRRAHGGLVSLHAVSFEIRELLDRRMGFAQRRAKWICTLLYGGRLGSVRVPTDCTR